MAVIHPFEKGEIVAIHRRRIALSPCCHRPPRPGSRQIFHIHPISPRPSTRGPKTPDRPRTKTWVTRQAVLVDGWQGKKPKKPARAKTVCCLKHRLATRHAMRMTLLAYLSWSMLEDEIPNRLLGLIRIPHREIPFGFARGSASWSK